MSVEIEQAPLEADPPADTPRREAPVTKAVVLKKSLIREYFESAVVTVIMALFGMTFVVQAVKVPTGSMENNILIGDHLLVNKFIFAPETTSFRWLLPSRTIRRGDIIVFKYPGRDEQERRGQGGNRVNYVKRVIGLPGETIEVQGTKVFVNGKELPEQRAWVKRDFNGSEALQVVSTDPRTDGSKYTVFYSEDRQVEDPFSIQDGRARFGVGNPFVIPAGHYYVMGDNRENSEDSRFWGTVPRANILGRALIVYWSIDRPETFASSGDEKSGLGNLVSDFFRKTRWSRTGRLIQ